MSVSGSATPSASSEGGAIKHCIPQLLEAVVEVTDLGEDSWENWRRVKEEVEGINRTDESGRVATARVHDVVSDRKVRKIGYCAFYQCTNLAKVTAPFVEEVGEAAFIEAFDLCHVTFGPDVVESGSFPRVSFSLGSCSFCWV